MNKTTLKNKLAWEGKILENSKKESFKVLEYNSSNEVHIEFIATGGKRIVSLSNMKKGNVSDYLSPSIYGIGYLGEGLYKTKFDGVQEVSYKIWQAILQRCYDKNCASYKNYGEKGVTICKEWQNYQNFAIWYENNYKDWMIGWALDKDILVKNNTIYSPSFCCFVPIKINALFTKRESKRGSLPIGVHLKSQIKNNKVYETIIAQINKGGEKIHLGCFKTTEEAFMAYKIAKEAHIKELALEYKEVLGEAAYNALMSYSVDITD